MKWNKTESSAHESYKGWVRPGAIPPGGAEPIEGETLDYLCGHFRIFQAEKGHRFSVDDLMVAWYGTTWCPTALRIADLGSGIGSVGMVAAWRCPGSIVYAVEAQEISLKKAEKSVHYNGLQNRYFLHHGDLRDPHLFGEEKFDLVLSSPPYWSMDSRVKSQQEQAVGARLEVRGDISDYARAGARLLAKGGVFASVFPNDQIDRAVAAYDQAGLLLLHQRDVIFKEGEPYGITLFAGSKKEDLPPAFQITKGIPEIETPLIIRRKDHSVHPSIALVRLAVGFSPGLI